MRVEAGEKLFGQDAVALRDAFAAFLDLETPKTWDGRQWIVGDHPRLDAAYLAGAMELAAAEAAALEADLLRNGYVDDERRPTSQGMALANASTLPPITRAEADELVAQLTALAGEINDEEGRRVFIGRLSVFGSWHVGTAAQLGDVDVILEYERPEGDDYQPEDMDEEEDIRERLGALSPYISLTGEYDATAMNAAKTVIYVRL